VDKCEPPHLAKRCTLYRSAPCAAVGLTYLWEAERAARAARSAGQAADADAVEPGGRAGSFASVETSIYFLKFRNGGPARHGAVCPKPTVSGCEPWAACAGTLVQCAQTVMMSPAACAATLVQHEQTVRISPAACAGTLVHYEQTVRMSPAACAGTLVRYE